jgi:hypothetical protein
MRRINDKELRPLAPYPIGLWQQQKLYLGVLEIAQDTLLACLVSLVNDFVSVLV